jgi:hypothetical protein
MAGIAARDVEDTLRTPSQLEYATTRPFFAMEVTPITANATIHSLRLERNWATDLGRVISFAAQRKLCSAAQRARPKSAAAIELVLRSEAASKQLSSAAANGGGTAVVEEMLKLPPDKCRCAGWRRRDRHLRSGEWIRSKRQQQCREHAEPLLSRARYR